MMDAPVGEYRIVSQVEATRLDERNQVTQGVDINVVDNQTSTPFTVFLPWDRYSAEGAQIIIKAKLAHIRAVHNLTN